MHKFQIPTHTKVTERKPEKVDAGRADPRANPCGHASQRRGVWHSGSEKVEFSREFVRFGKDGKGGSSPVDVVSSQMARGRRPGRSWDRGRDEGSRHGDARWG